MESVTVVSTAKPAEFAIGDRVQLTDRGREGVPHKSWSY
jgi:hypothetical protein